MPWKNQLELREYYREYRAKNRKKMREYNRKYNTEWRKKNGYHNEVKWRKNNPAKIYAERKLHRAVASGKVLKRGCLHCKNNKTVAHHPNYDKPLEIIWICRAHHRQIHYGN